MADFQDTGVDLAGMYAAYNPQADAVTAVSQVQDDATALLNAKLQALGIDPTQLGSFSDAQLKNVSSRLYSQEQLWKNSGDYWAKANGTYTLQSAGQANADPSAPAGAPQEGPAGATSTSGTGSAGTEQPVLPPDPVDYSAPIAKLQGYIANLKGDKVPDAKQPQIKTYEARLKEYQARQSAPSAPQANGAPGNGVEGAQTPFPGVTGDFQRPANLPPPTPGQLSGGPSDMYRTQMSPDGTFSVDPNRLQGIKEQIAGQLPGATPEELQQRALQHLTMEYGATGSNFQTAQQQAQAQATPKAATAPVGVPTITQPKVDYSKAIATNQAYVKTLSAIKNPSPAQQASLAAAQAKITDYSGR
jgi:hypothetical protein